jgi:hypothetical protein
MSHFDDALKCFNENLTSLGDMAANANAETMEAYNLYCGLAALAEGMRNLELRVKQIEKRLSRG